MPALLKTTQIQEPSSATVNINLDSSGNVGIGTASPSALLHVSGTSTTAIDRIASTSTGATSFDGSGTGLELTAGNMNTTSKYTPAIKFGSTDTAFTTTNPKFGAAIIATAAQSYSSDTTGGMNLEFWTSPTSPGTGNGLVQRALIDSNGYMQGTVNGLGAGRIPAMQYYRLDSNLAGANVNTAQSTFGVGVTLVGSTVYAFQYVAVFSKTAGTTSHSFSILFGGTATLNNIMYGGSSNNVGSAWPAGQNAGANSFSTNAATALQFAAGVTSANRFFEVFAQGTVSVNAGGTLIPQYILSAAPGGAYSTVAGSYFAIYPLAASGANVNIGSWA